MAITFGTGAALTTGTATSIELPLPTNAAGDLLMAFGMAGVDAGTEGPTLDINETGYGNQYVHDKTGGTDSTGIVESKFSTGGETTALTLQITPGTALDLKGQVFAVSGVHADVWDATPVAGTGIQNNVGNGDGAGTYKTPAITTATANAVVLSFIHKEGGGASSGVTPPSGYTVLIDPVAQNGVNPIFGVAYKLVASPGTETPGSWSGWGGSTADLSGFTVALKAAVDGQPAHSRRRGIPGMNTIGSHFGRGW